MPRAGRTAFCAAFFALSATACDRAPIPSTATDTLLIGVAVALTGDLQSIGAIEQNATRVAEQHINASGGILGRRVSFQVVDDQTSTKGFQGALDGLLPQKPAALIGPTSSGQAIDAQNRIFTANLIQISASASTPTMTTAQPAINRTFFRTAASHELQARAFALLAAKGSAGLGGLTQLNIPKCLKAIVIHNDDDYGTPIAKSIKQHLEERGGAVVDDIPIPGAAKGSYDTEAARVITKASGMGADCQILVTFPPAGGGYMLSYAKGIEQNTTRDWRTFTTMGSNGVFQQTFIDKSRTGAEASSTRAEGTVGLSPESNPPTPQFNEFSNLFRAMVIGAPATLPAYASNQFDAAILLALAIENAGTATDTKRIREALFEVSRPPGQAFGPGQLSEALAAIRRGEDIDYQGASGAVDFDDYGDVSSDYILWKIEGGALKTDAHWRILASDLK